MGKAKHLKGISLALTLFSRLKIVTQTKTCGSFRPIFKAVYVKFEHARHPYGQIHGLP